LGRAEELALVRLADRDVRCERLHNRSAPESAPTVEGGCGAQ
jgi:hypothetical protein